MKKAPVKVVVIRTAGTNCDQETAYAFSYFGAEVELVHINQLISGNKKLSQYHILAIPGGFTYGDDIESGRVLANELRIYLGQELQQFVAEGKLIIGICNGFQVLVRAGLLPGYDGQDAKSGHKQTVTLTVNDSGKFEDRWTSLCVSGKSPWTKNLDDIVYFPVAHREGKFMTVDKAVLQTLIRKNQVAFRYCAADGKEPVYPDNPNGSQDDIAGITDSTGRVLGLMPHPERHFQARQHPFWTRRPNTNDLGTGARIFENGVSYIKKEFLS